MKQKVQKTHKPVEAKRDVGAIVFLIAHALGDFEVMSLDRKVYASGSTLDQAFWRYYKKGERVMKKRGQLPAAHPAAQPIAVQETVAPEAITDIPVDNDFKDV